LRQKDRKVLPNKLLLLTHFYAMSIEDSWVYGQILGLNKTTTIMKHTISRKAFSQSRFPKFFISKSLFVIACLFASSLAFSQTISGKVIFDANNNGTEDGNDIAQPAVIVQLYIDANNNDIADASELSTSTTTDRDGAYSFSNVSGKAILTVDTLSMGKGTALSSQLIVASGQGSSTADLYLTGQSPLCYAVADTGDDLVAFNRNNGEVTVVATNISSNDLIEALTTNYNATLLYAIDGDIFLKYDYNTGAVLNGTGNQIGTITYRTSGGGTSTTNIDDADGIAIAGVNDLWVSEVSAGGIIFKVDTNGNVINNVFGTGIHGVEITLPSAISSCGQLDDLAFSPKTGKLYGVYNGCNTSTEYLVEIPVSGANAGVVTRYEAITLNGTVWTDIEGIGFSSTGEMLGTTGANGIASQQEHVLFFNEESLELTAVQQINYASGGDFESCDCITQKSDPFTQVSIAGTVYNDVDGLLDNAIDGTGTGTAGGSVLYAYLTDANNRIIQKQQVASDGSYAFNNLTTQFAFKVVISTSSVAVGEDAPSSAALPGNIYPSGEQFGLQNQFNSGIESGTPNMQIAVTTGTNNVTYVDFGFNTPNVIEGAVWKDINRDGTLDVNETERAANVQVTLYSDANGNGVLDAGEMQPVATTETDANGDYTFVRTYVGSGTDAFIMLVDTADLPSGNTLTTALTQTASFNSSGQTDSDNDFGYNLDPTIVRITGTVWKDENEDGNIDAGENERAENIRLRIYEDANTNGSIDGDEPFIYVDATTDANGYYEVNLPYTSAVTYLVEVAENQLEGDLTTNAILSASFSSGGTIVSDRDFGYNPNSNVKYISGTVFNDNNQDTLLNAGDLGDEGVDVYLYVDANGNGVLDANENTPVATTTTDKNGYYEFEQNNSCQTGTISTRISQDNDDAREKVSDGKMKRDDKKVKITDEGDEIVGLRWTNVNIPQGAEIQIAYIQFEAEDDGDEDGTVTIHGFLETNTNRFSNGKNDISGRDETNASATWFIDASNWDEDQQSTGERSSDISSIIEEIVGQSGWSSGNALGVKIEGGSADVEAKSRDKSSSDAPLLYVSYKHSCNDNFIVKIDENDLPSGYAYSTDDIETAVNLTGGGVFDIGNDFGYKFEGALSGTVFLDQNGDNKVNGTGISEANQQQLYVHLVKSNNKVLFKMPVNNDGTYRFDNVPAGSYTVVLSTEEGRVGLAPPTAKLPRSWANTGEKLGNGVGNDGNINGILEGISVNTSEVTNANLAILKNITVAIDDDNSTWVNTAVSGDVTTNDFDPEGHTQDFGSFLNQDGSGNTISSGASVSGVDESGSTVSTAGTVTFHSNGTYTFTPTSTFVGLVNIPYSICDNGSPNACDTAILRINVREQEDPTLEGSNSIIANNDDIVSYGQEVSSIAVINDADPEKDAFSVTSFKYDNSGNMKPNKPGTLGASATIAGEDENGDKVQNAGTFLLNSDGTYTFNPTSGFVGRAIVEYEICDTVANPHTACDKAFIYITVYDDNGAANDPPLAGDDFASTAMNVKVRGSWIGNDLEANSEDININGASTDIDLDDASGNNSTTALSTLTTRQGGTVKIFANGEYEYTPPTDYVGPDQVGYEICDVTNVAPQPLCDSATIHFIVNPIVRDYGDLPSSLYADAWNIFKDANNDGIPEGNRPIWLGTSVTNEEGTRNGGNSTADTDTDDGLTFPSFLDTSKANIFKVTVNSSITGTRVWFKIFLDWDQDGTFDSTYVGSGVTQSPTTVDVPVFVPSGEDGDFYARVRVALDSAEITPSGGANNGETEDYTGSFTPLPVELTYFNAEKAGRTSLLTWQTASELNNSHFEVQRKTTISDWEHIGEVEGNGTSSQINNYQFVDYNPGQGVNYYRLKQVDFDGQFEYSEIKAVSFKPQLEMIVYPNPAQDVVNVTLGTSIESDITVSVFDAYGKELQRVQLHRGQTAISLNILGYRTGFYFIKTEIGSDEVTQKVMVY
jgi:hypothetical protein